jgi:hypothetical protein
MCSGCLTTKKPDLLQDLLNTTVFESPSSNPAVEKNKTAFFALKRDAYPLKNASPSATLINALLRLHEDVRHKLVKHQTQGIKEDVQNLATAICTYFMKKQHWAFQDLREAKTNPSITQIFTAALNALRIEERENMSRITEQEATKQSKHPKFAWGYIKEKFDEEVEASEHAKVEPEGAIDFDDD